MFEHWAAKGEKVNKIGLFFLLILAIKFSAQTSSFANSPYEDIPEEFCCPGHGGVMVEPVIAMDQITYDKQWITRYINIQGKTPPPAKISMLVDFLIPNDELRARICDWKEQHNVDGIPISNPEFSNVDHGDSWVMSIEKNPLLRILKPWFC